jgi:hypothetical protein
MDKRAYPCDLDWDLKRRGKGKRREGGKRRRKSKSKDKHNALVGDGVWFFSGIR